MTIISFKLVGGVYWPVVEGLSCGCRGMVWADCVRHVVADNKGVDLGSLTWGGG